MHILAAFRDLTERLEAEQKSRQLEIAAAEAEAANRAKSMFLSTMSHEIRTPMNAIMGYSQLMLRDSQLGPDAKANLKIINRSGEHLLHIINDVLDMAKIEAGRLQLTPITFNLRSLVSDIEAMFRLQAEAKALQFGVRVSGEPVEYIVADEGKIRQILINLLGNAIKFTVRGRIDLHVSLNHRTDGRLWVSADVEDTGIGLSPGRTRGPPGAHCRRRSRESAVAKPRWTPENRPYVDTSKPANEFAEVRTRSVIPWDA